MIDKIVIHCSDSPHGRGDDAKTIHQWHIERGWSGIGYHWVITEDGDIQAGRPWYWKGAHVSGFNSNSLGVCLIGRHEFTEEQLESLVQWVEILLDEHPGAKVFNHYDLDPGKSCPNFDASKLIADRLSVKRSAVD